jgi:hypothetical protein
MKLLESMLDPSCSPSPVQRDTSYMARVQDCVLAPHCFAVKTNVLSHCHAGSSSLWSPTCKLPPVDSKQFRVLSLLTRAPSGVVQFALPAKKYIQHHHHYHLFQAVLTNLWPSVMVSTFRWSPVCFTNHIGDIGFP